METEQNVRPRYKSSKGDADQRKKTSIDNMAKARAVKLERLREEKAEQESQIEISDSDYTDDSSSSEEELMIVPKKKRLSKPVKKQSYSKDADRIQEMENKILSLISANKRKKKQKVVKKTIIQMPQQQQQPKANPQKEIQKKYLLDL